MIYRTLGSTGEKVSAIGVGGWHLGLKHVDEHLAVRIVRTAIDRGINFLDNCWDYNDGASETRMGRALGDGYRQKAFVMTKIDGRSKKEATKQLNESLKRLQVDCIDLVQHHEILRYEDPHRIFSRKRSRRWSACTTCGTCRLLSSSRASTAWKYSIRQSTPFARFNPSATKSSKSCSQKRQRRLRLGVSNRLRRPPYLMASEMAW